MLLNWEGKLPKLNHGALTKNDKHLYVNIT
jgi:hypothetical protein